MSVNARDVDSLALRDAEFATYRVVVTADVLNAQNVLRLRAPDAASPAAVEGARDSRELGVAVREIRWQRPQVPAQQ